ncbi:GMC oxidoreductase-domain-containing protein [Penicillium capsulatum]|uniref:glucose oxidase n=1 Tax=Penicillium capsulatum TaxID=69766 RepID=A0A9W9HSF1_9EURO|nr:GMC oxidoreductase-domain-containing protein [Penicillium capsulatum]KAJ6105523.1 GMC oxidoreductase-domain-containing protein [Penicillium capsulatum]
MKPAPLKFFLFLTAATFGAASPPNEVDIQSHLVSDPKEVSGKEYDYIIAGGGLTGLTAAVKLTDNPKINVLVIEKGFYESNDGSIIEDPSKNGDTFGTNVDYSYSTVPMKINDQALQIRSGKGLGGSTLINNAAWTRPDHVQLDAWEKIFKNEGWNWKNLRKYMDQAEHSRPPTSAQNDAGHHFEPACHGLNGTVHTGPLDNGKPWSPVTFALMNTTAVLGVSNRTDLACGSPHGVSMIYSTVLENQTRADAAREWLAPAYDRKNLKILTGQMVGKVLFDKAGRTANGVEFGTNKAIKFTATAKREILLAAGSIITPQILEYSGIGLKNVLNKAGVEQRVDLPVGVNMQDQITTTVDSRVKSPGNGQGQAAYFANFIETFGENALNATSLLRSKIGQWAQDTVDRGGFHNVTALKIQYETYRDWLLDDKVAYSELLMDANGKIKFDVSALLPFTRGSVHILNKDPYLMQYALDPKYFLNELDVFGQAAATKLARDLSSSGDMKQYFDGETTPGDKLDAQADIDAWIPYVKDNFRSSYQAIGTCSMMSRELGGVVDSNAKVYDIKGLRVIDASIIPTQVSGHVMSVLYASALKISEAILKDYKD